MSEIEALLELYGAIDRAVVAGEADVEGLGLLLGAYRNDAATGWFDDQYVPWVEAVRERALVRERAESGRKLADRPELDLAEAPPPEDSPDDLGEALASPDESSGESGESVALGPHAQEVYDALAALPSEPLEGRMAARRLLAVTAAARALPDLFGVGGSHVSVANAALVFKDPGRDSDAGEVARRAQEVQARFAEQFVEMSDWTTVVRTAVRDGLLPTSFQNQEHAPPCTGKLIMVADPDGTDPDPCTVMEAGFFVDGLAFDQAKVYLEPSNWLYPDSLWCRMEKDTPLGPNSWLYHETVSTSCPPKPGGWSVSTDLQFWFSHPTPTEARVEYDLAPGLPTPLSDIEIDEGSLRIIQRPNDRIEVRTTKRVRFTDSFDGAGLSMFLCATGYSSVLEDMFFTVATAPATTSKPFPIQPPQGGTMSPTSNAKNPTSATASGYDAGSDTLDALASEAADFVESCLKDCAATGKSSLEMIQAGTYKVEDAWADGTKMWSMYLSGVAKAFDLGTRTAKAFAQKPSDET